VACALCKAIDTLCLLKNTHKIVKGGHRRLLLITPLMKKSFANDVNNQKLYGKRKKRIYEV
jgi:hypothetical protein